MITEQDLIAAIAECQGQRNPNANTCIKLAAFYTILDHVREQDAPVQDEPLRYSFAAGDTTESKIDFNSGTEFSALIDGRKASAVWSVMDELMDVLQATQPRLYNGVLNQIRET